MQILGSNLTEALYELGATGTLQALTKVSDGQYFEVWEISEPELVKLEKIPASEWKSSYGWWRYGHCIYEGSADFEYTVNGKVMKGYEPQNNFIQSEFDSYLDWLENVMNLSTETNIAIVAISLAQDNGMTLAEFMNTYQG
ncbi:hypothetical protein PQ478_09205 [Alkalihalophilus pseudofirmus]|uniref:hypothetical protein n=1 Tax=Alkalihalophilus pseudofirmus TaxID=79885 RepID=UPI00259AF261|nr:hypothetical protein [Alkalihalophilus pseudofirmus]WEG18646.1 hypothetical protein PQ478_09205 [Alkalihalophilus pseudofirmus]